MNFRSPNLKARAKSLILKWFDGSSQPPEMRGKLALGVDRFVDEIAKRNSWSECMTILLGDHSAPQFQASGQGWRVVPCQKGLAVSTVVPGWGFGWRKALRDEYVYDVLSWLGHYARQYIHRSHVAKVLMIAWERDRAVLHPFGSEAHSCRYGAVTPPVLPRMALSTAVEDSVSRWGGVEAAPRSRSRWTRRNTFDPAVHQAVFHFLRGQSLLSAGFELEALVAIDCVLQSLQTIGWTSVVGDPRRSRSDLITTLGMHQNDAQLAEHVYFLRNEFAAHAGGWRWWDTVEHVDGDLMERASDMALRVLNHAADAEPTVRRINPEPDNWSDWLMDSFPLLFSAIWFRAG
ncbi:hypothetical protein GCM10011497_04380 [Elstera cyanobacteriorum]|nr:hypothetical protein [Elstera cyanobacteriorum]GFZ79343.1 hypothetical protein GCM10011497_04380 [Elstera cyanobacteriorum]